VFKRAFKQLREDYPLLCRNWTLLCPSICHNDIQPQESLEEDSGTQYGIGGCSSTPRRRYHGVQARDSYKQIFVCFGFCLHVVLDTLVDHHHPNKLQRHWNDATKFSTAMHFLRELIQHRESFHLRRIESLVQKRILANHLLETRKEGDTRQ